MKEVIIYGLIDPRNNQIRYVGKTIQSLRVRLRNHITDKPKNNTYKYNWIQSLLKDGLEPNIFEIERCRQDTWVEREKHWISKIENLTNLTTGGEGCDFFEKEILEKIGKKVKLAWENEEYRENISKQRKKYWSNPENRKSHSDKLKNRPITEEHKEKIRMGRKDRKPISIDGVEYLAIKDAARKLNMYKDTIKRRLKSEKYPNYFFL